MSDGEPIGDLLDSLGVTYDPDDGDLVASAVVLLKVIDADGVVVLRMCPSDGISWIDKLGMLRAAEIIESKGLRQVEED